MYLSTYMPSPVLVPCPTLGHTPYYVLPYYTPRICALPSALSLGLVPCPALSSGPVPCSAFRPCAPLCPALKHDTLYILPGNLMRCLPVFWPRALPYPSLGPLSFSALKPCDTSCHQTPCRCLVFRYCALPCHQALCLPMSSCPGPAPILEPNALPCLRPCPVMFCFQASCALPCP